MRCAFPPYAGCPMEAAMTTAITTTMTVGEATVRLLLTGNTNEWVLARLQETHPGQVSKSYLM
jgi:hypothetical protein